MTSASMPGPDAAAQHLGHERADVQAIEERQRQRRLAGRDQLARLDEAMDHDGVGRRAQLALVHGGLRLLEHGLGPGGVVLRLLHLPRAGAFAQRRQAARRHLQRRFEALHLGRRAIHVAAGADLALEQELLALQLLLRQVEGGRPIVHLRLGGGQLRAARAGLEVADAGLRGGDAPTGRGPP